MPVCIRDLHLLQYFLAGSPRVDSVHASVDNPVASVAALLMVVVVTMAFVCAPVSEPKGGGGEDEIPERFECGDKEGEGRERGNSKGERDAERKASESMTTLPRLLLVFVRARSSG